MRPEDNPRQDANGPGGSARTRGVATEETDGASTLCNNQMPYTLIPMVTSVPGYYGMYADYYPLKYRKKPEPISLPLPEFAYDLRVASKRERSPSIYDAGPSHKIPRMTPERLLTDQPRSQQHYYTQSPSSVDAAAVALSQWQPQPQPPPPPPPSPQGSTTRQKEHDDRPTKFKHSKNSAFCAYSRSSEHPAADRQ